MVMGDNGKQHQLGSFSCVSVLSSHRGRGLKSNASRSPRRAQHLPRRPWRRYPYIGWRRGKKGDTCFFGDSSEAASDTLVRGNARDDEGSQGWIISLRLEGPLRRSASDVTTAV